MYVKLLQYFIFAFSIFSSRGFPQEYIPPDYGPPNNEPPKTLPENEPSHYEAPYRGPFTNVTYDDASQNNQPVEDDHENIEPEENEPLNEENQPLYVENMPLNEEYDDPDNIDGENNAGNTFSVNEQNDQYDQASNFFPSPQEMIDRTNAEPGFDLTNEEILKLKLWPDALVPYYIDVHSFSDKVLRDKIRSFLSSVNSLTSLNFVELPGPPNDDSRWVMFINRRGLLGCADHSIRNFTNTGVQHVILGYHCMSTEGELAEAVLAIAGVPPQHNAPDRDNYININDINIMPEKKYLFEKLSDDEWLFHDLEYDFKSAGHFHSYKHSINGRATIEPKTNLEGIILGESKALTSDDILKIRMLYNYMVKTKLLQAPDCHKLFEPGKNFNQYRPNDEKLKPRPKPYKYTGKDENLPLQKNSDEEVLPNYEENIDVKKNKKKKNLQTEKNNLDKNEKNLIHESVGREPFLDNYDYENFKENNDPHPNNPIMDDQSQNINPADENNIGKKPTIVNIGKGNIHELKRPPMLDFETDNVFQMLPLKTPMKKKRKRKENKNIDILSRLSDFNTDDENRGFKHLKGYQSKNISPNKYFDANSKQDLKFKSYYSQI